MIQPRIDNAWQAVRSSRVVRRAAIGDVAAAGHGPSYGACVTSSDEQNEHDPQRVAEAHLSVLTAKLRA